MKAIKILSVGLTVIFFNSLFFGNVFGQNSEVKQKDEINTNVKQSGVADVLADDQISDKKQANEKYRIGYQDTVEIQVFRHPELSQTVNVNPDGTILMPRLDKPIVAVCKTERELGETLATLYNKDYLRNPFVTVRVVNQLSQPFAVIGAVEKPGSFYLNRRIRLLELLAFAGGPKTDKAGAKIQVARVGNIAGCVENTESQNSDTVEFLAFRTNDVMAGKDNPWMQPGDIVSVLEAEEAYIVGNVKKPTKISLREPVTLTQAIAIAEGLNDTAKTDKVIIQRQASGTQTKTELAYNLKDINSKKIPDPQLQANDIVEISNDKTKSLINGFRDAMKSGIPSILYRIP